MIFIYKFRPDKGAPTVLVGGGRIGSHLVINNAARAEGRRLNIARIVEMAGQDFVVNSLRGVAKDTGQQMEIEPVGDSAVRVNGQAIGLYVPKDGEGILYELYKREGIQRVIEATGKRVDADAARIHTRESGVKQVLVTANAKGKGSKNILVGINEQDYDPALHDVVGGASCTTGSGAPTVKAMDEAFGVECFSLTTIHAHTGDELKTLRKRRQAGTRPTLLEAVDHSTQEATGAAQGIVELVPSVRGKLLDAISFRVPVENGSATILDFVLKSETDAHRVLESLSGISRQSPRLLAIPDDLRFDEKQDKFISPSMASTSGVLGYKTSGVLSSIICKGKMCRIIINYDNEAGPPDAYLDLGLFTEGRLSEDEEKAA